MIDAFALVADIALDRTADEDWPELRRGDYAADDCQSDQYRAGAERPSNGTLSLRVSQRRDDRT